MAWLSFLKSKDFDPVEFEKDLASIAKRISHNERNLSKFAYQQQRMKKFIIKYGISVYVALLGYILYETGMNWRVFSLRQGIHTVLIPIVLMVLIKLVTITYSLRKRRAESNIERLKFESDSMIEDLKEKTKFSSTQALLNRFADGGDLDAQLDEAILEKQKKLDEITQVSIRNEALPQAQQRSLFDTIVDSVIGADELSVERRYALVCVNCYNHNGLAPPGQEPRDVLYRCPRCGVMNGQAADTEAEDSKPQAEESKGEDTEIAATG
jgi:hypothetical protein